MDAGLATVRRGVVACIYILSNVAVCGIPQRVPGRPPTMDLSDGGFHH